MRQGVGESLHVLVHCGCCQYLHSGCIYFPPLILSGTFRPFLSKTSVGAELATRGSVSKSEGVTLPPCLPGPRLVRVLGLSICKLRSTCVVTSSSAPLSKALLVTQHTRRVLMLSRPATCLLCRRWEAAQTVLRAHRSRSCPGWALV